MLPQKAAYLADHGTLLVADAHIGKAISFRKWGVPVPSGTTQETLSVLSDALASTGARRIVFLGDFLHSERSHSSTTLDAVSRWRDAHASIELTLVRGNHDDRAGDPPYRLGIEALDEPLSLAGFALCHHPQPIDGQYVLAGHLHPCVHIRGRAFDRLRLPCFHLGAAVGVLPAFGAFTGMHAVSAQPGDRIYAVVDDEVVDVF